MTQLIFVMALVPLPNTLNVRYVSLALPVTVHSKKLTQAYALYIAVIKEYKNKWEALECLNETKLHKTFHAMVLNAHNEPRHTFLPRLHYKKNEPYQELPYLYFKKNLDATKRTVTTYLETLDTQDTVEQSAIGHCLHYVLKKIELLDKFIITTPEYYQEQIKTASVKQSTSPVFQLLQASLGFMMKKCIPLF